MKTPEEVADMMDRGYADGTAYQTSLPFDEQRGVNIRRTTAILAHEYMRETTLTLDVGSGEGGIASFWPHTNIVGVEISAVAIEKARKAHPNVKFICAPIERFELGAGMEPFDLAVAQESIEHWTDAAAGLKAIRAAMRRGGHLVLTTPNRDSLHCRIRRKLGMPDAPYCSHDHIREFGFHELIEFVSDQGFVKEQSMGVGLLPYWTMEDHFGPAIRNLTDADEEVVRWLEDMGASIPPEYAFIQCHRFRRAN